MHINEYGAKSLICAMIQSAFADARRLYRAEYLNADMTVTDKAIDHSTPKPFVKGVVGQEQQRRIYNERHHSGSRAAMAFELQQFFRSQACADMLEMFNIDADPVQCASRAVANNIKHTNKREV